MKPVGSSKRSSGRSTERHRALHTKSSSGSSNDAKMRGNPQQFVEKYLNVRQQTEENGNEINVEEEHKQVEKVI